MLHIEIVWIFTCKIPGGNSLMTAKGIRDSPIQGSNCSVQGHKTPTPI